MEGRDHKQLAHWTANDGHMAGRDHRRGRGGGGATGWGDGWLWEGKVMTLAQMGAEDEAGVEAEGGQGCR